MSDSRLGPRPRLAPHAPGPGQPAAESARATELARQQALLHALWQRELGPVQSQLLCTDPSRTQRGLQAYTANAGASAERALAACFPTVQAMVGEESFAALARAHWLATPPVHGDLACWGADLPEFLAATRSLADWPCLPDCARLDWQVFHAERAADAAFDADSLSLLESDDPDVLTLVLAPGSALISSAHPVATVWAAHHGSQGGSPGAWESARRALAEGRAEHALVARHGWRAQVHRLDDATARWTHAVLSGSSLGEAFLVAGDTFEFEPWLVTTLQRQGLAAVRRRAA